MNVRNIQLRRPIWLDNPTKFNNLSIYGKFNYTQKKKKIIPIKIIILRHFT